PKPTTPQTKRRGAPLRDTRHSRNHRRDSLQRTAGGAAQASSSMLFPTAASRGLPQGRRQSAEERSMTSWSHEAEFQQFVRQICDGRGISQAEFDRLVVITASAPPDMEQQITGLLTLMKIGR